MNKCYKNLIMDKIVYVFIGLLFALALLIAGLGIFLWGDEEV
jgi:hypothetical protein